MQFSSIIFWNWYKTFSKIVWSYIGGFDFFSFLGFHDTNLNNTFTCLMKVYSKRLDDGIESKTVDVYSDITINQLLCCNLNNQKYLLLTNVKIVVSWACASLFDLECQMFMKCSFFVSFKPAHHLRTIKHFLTVRSNRGSVHVTFTAWRCFIMSTIVKTASC